MSCPLVHSAVAEPCQRVAAVQQQRPGPFGTQSLHQRGQVREAADLAVDLRCLHEVEAGEGMRLRGAGRDAEVRKSASPTRCGGWPRAAPTPRFTLGSRKCIGMSCA